MRFHKKLIMILISCVLVSIFVPTETHAKQPDNLVSRELAKKAAASVIINAVSEYY